jgi:hypothetical protein
MGHAVRSWKAGANKHYAITDCLITFPVPSVCQPGRAIVES